MRITIALLFAVLAAASSQEFGARLNKLGRTGRIGQSNGYFYPEPSPPFPLPTTTTTRRPAPTTAASVQEIVTLPPADYLPPVPTTTAKTYVQCSAGQTCAASSSDCASRNGRVTVSGCLASGREGVCCQPIPTTTTTTTTAKTYVQCSAGQTCAASSSDCASRNGRVTVSGCLASGREGVCCQPIPTTTTTTTTTTTAKTYVQCSAGQTCALSSSDCASRNGRVTVSGCLASGREGVCCQPIPTTTTTTTTTTRRPTTTTTRATTVPVRTTQRPAPTTTPSLEYLPPTTTKGYNYPVPDNPLFPDNTNENPQFLQTTKAPTTRKPTTAPVVQEDDEIAFWDFRESIPGEPEIDYPIFEKIPETAFTCSGKIDGFYADIEARCQVFHVCVSVPEAEPIKNSFLCPNGTLFHQESFACQWWPDVECASSTNFFSLNENIGKVPDSAVAASNDVRISAGQAGISASASASSSSVKLAAAPNSGRKY